MSLSRTLFEWLGVATLGMAMYDLYLVAKWVSSKGIHFGANQLENEDSEIEDEE